MDFIVLKYYLKLMETKNFSLASEELFITQPTLSQQISKLETELGVKLINRTTRAFEITEAGQIFACYAEKMLDMETELKNDLKKFSSSQEHILRVGMIPTMGRMKQTKNVLSFVDSHRDVALEVFENYSGNLYKLLSKKKIDIAISNHIDEIEINLCSQITEIPFMEGKIVVVCGEQHKFANRKYVTLEETAEEPLIKMVSYSSISKIMMAQLKRHKLTPKVACECETTSNMISLVDASYGISYLSDNIASCYATERTRIIPLVPDIIHRTVILVRKEDLNNPVIQEFLKHMEQFSQHVIPLQ